MIKLFRRGDDLDREYRRSRRQSRQHSLGPERRAHLRSRSGWNERIAKEGRRTTASSERWISRRSRGGGDLEDGSSLRQPTSSERRQQVPRRSRRQDRGRPRMSREVSVTAVSQLGEAIVEGMAKFTQQLTVKDNDPLTGLNGTLNQAIGVSPSEALMGNRVISQGQLETNREEVVDVTEIRARKESHMERYQAKQKWRFDQKRSKSQPYFEGDLVLVRITSYGRQPQITTEMTRPLPNYKGSRKRAI